MLNQIIVTTAACYRTKASRAIKHFEDNSGIIGETPDDSDIDSDEFAQAAAPKAIDQSVELFALSALAQNFQYRISEFTEFLNRFFARLAPEFIDHLQHIVPSIRRNILLAQEIGPKFPVANSDDEIFFCETKRAQKIDAKGE